jgi:hypothetical protein
MIINVCNCVLLSLILHAPVATRCVDLSMKNKRPGRPLLESELLIANAFNCTLPNQPNGLGIPVAQTSLLGTQTGLAAMHPWK